MTYKPSSADWKYDAKKAHTQGEWIVGILFYPPARKAGLQDLHIIVNRANSKGCYSDVHISLKLLGGGQKSIFYQINGGQLVADYALAPHGWRASSWVHFPGLREPAEAEALAFAKYCAARRDLDYAPGGLDPKDPGQPKWVNPDRR